jgi:Cft2 family RNA processing exonuclease
MFSYDERGIRLDGSDFWLDAHRKVSFSFISHGHSDHLKNHEKILATPATARFHAMRVKQKNSIVLDYGQVMDYGDLRIQLYPAGHILGSAMIRIERNDSSLLYTGDFKMKPSRTAEPIEIPPADILIMESTFGSPEYIIDCTQDHLIEQLVEFVNNCFWDNLIPVVLGYGLGKAQEAMKILGEIGFNVKVHRYAWNFTRVYEEFGAHFENCSLWEGEEMDDAVLIVPPHLHKSIKKSLKLPVRSVLLSGWANGVHGFRYHSDTAIPLSDHADFSDLLAFVKKVNPAKIYTVHGFAEFPDILKSMGYDADLLRPRI